MTTFCKHRRVWCISHEGGLCNACEEFVATKDKQFTSSHETCAVSWQWWPAVNWLHWMHLSFALSLYIHIKYLLHDDMHSIVLMYWTHVCEQTWRHLVALVIYNIKLYNCSKVKGYMDAACMNVGDICFFGPPLTTHRPLPWRRLSISLSAGYNASFVAWSRHMFAGEYVIAL